MEVSKITSKNQTTIPKAIRKFLDLSSDDFILYRIENDRCYIERAQKFELCPLCEGSGKTKDKKACFLCEEEGRILSDIRLLHHLIIRGTRYNVNVQFNSAEAAAFSRYSKCTITSDHYGVQTIWRAQDYVQMLLIKQHLVLDDGNYISVPVEDEKVILAMMKTSEGKQALENFMRQPFR